MRKTLIPNLIRILIGADQYDDERFTRAVGEQVAPRALLLNAGLGSVPFSVALASLSFPVKLIALRLLGLLSRLPFIDATLLAGCGNMACAEGR